MGNLWSYLGSSSPEDIKKAQQIEDCHLTGRPIEDCLRSGGQVVGGSKTRLKRQRRRSIRLSKSKRKK